MIFEGLGLGFGLEFYRYGPTGLPRKPCTPSLLFVGHRWIGISFWIRLAFRPGFYEHYLKGQGTL